MDVSTSHQNGISDGSNQRRRRRSSSSGGESDLVVLSVVFNKKKQKQNDEVAIAIERLRENGVNCVLFTMNDFRNGTRKQDSSDQPDAFRLCTNDQEGNSEWKGKNTDQAKFPPPMPLLPLPSIKCEASENSNGSTDSESSISIHKTVEKVINSFSASSSPSPPPLSPPHSFSQHTASIISNVTPFTDLSAFLTPLLNEAKSAAKEEAKKKEELKLQDIQVCSTSSVHQPKAGTKRRRRKVRRFYAIRKVRKSKPKSSAAKKQLEAQIKSELTNGTVPTSSTHGIDSITSSDEVVRQSQDSSNGDCNEAIHSESPEDCKTEKTAGSSVNSDAVIAANDASANHQCSSTTLLLDEDSRHPIPDSSSCIPEEAVGQPIKRKKSNHRKRKKKASRKKSSRKALPNGEAVGLQATPNISEITAQPESTPCPNNIQIVPAVEITAPQDIDSDPLQFSAAQENGCSESIESAKLCVLANKHRAFSPDICGIRRLVIEKSSTINGLDNFVTSATQVISGVHEATSVLIINSAQSCVHVDTISNADNVQDATKLQQIAAGREAEAQPLQVISSNPTKPQVARKRKSKFTHRRKKRKIASVQQNGHPEVSNLIETDVETVVGLSLDENPDLHSMSSTSTVQTVATKLSQATNDVERSIETALGQIKLEAPSEEVNLVCQGLNPKVVLTNCQKVSSLPKKSEIDCSVSSSESSSTPGNNINDQKTDGSIDSVAESDETLEGSKCDLIPGVDDSLPATLDGMQLRRSNFYSLITDNVRRNIDTYLDGRHGSKTPSKRRKRIKNSYLLNHGDNCPEDPEVPYRLHLATQVLLKLNKRRLKSKPKEDRGKTLLSYLKLVSKRPPRTGKPAAAIPNSSSEDVTEPVEEPVFSGEWSIPRKYVCHVCGQVEKGFWDMVMHKGEQHPGVVVTHTELPNTVPVGLVRKPAVPPIDIRSEEELNSSTCTKCSASFSNTDDLHRHVFECAGNAFWLMAENEVRKKKTKRRRGFKRRLSSTPKTTPKKSKVTELKRRPSEVFKCDFCSREFKTEGWLKNHVVTHSLPVSIPLEKLSLPSRASNNSTSSRLFKS